MCKAVAKLQYHFPNVIGGRYYVRFPWCRCQLRILLFFRPLLCLLPFDAGWLSESSRPKQSGILPKFQLMLLQARPTKAPRLRCSLPPLPKFAGCCFLMWREKGVPAAEISWQYIYRKTHSVHMLFIHSLQIIRNPNILPQFKGNTIQVVVNLLLLLLRPEFSVIVKIWIIYHWPRSELIAYIVFVKWGQGLQEIRLDLPVFALKQHFPIRTTETFIFSPSSPTSHQLMSSLEVVRFLLDQCCF